VEPLRAICYPRSMRALALSLALVAAFAATGCDDESKASINKALGRYRAYDGKAVPAEQLQKAYAQAKAEKKRVLVQFGGNWCVFCQALDELIEADATLKDLKHRYVAIHIDAANADDLNQRWGKPFDHGFPVLVVLDDSGTLLHTQPMTAFIRGGSFDPGGVAGFLRQWAGSGT
jgi:thiol:disulfide interchange protein